MTLNVLPLRSRNHRPMLTVNACTLWEVICFAWCFTRIPLPNVTQEDNLVDTSLAFGEFVDVPRRTMWLSLVHRNNSHFIVLLYHLQLCERKPTGGDDGNSHLDLPFLRLSNRLGLTSILLHWTGACQRHHPYLTQGARYWTKYCLQSSFLPSTCDLTRWGRVILIPHGLCLLTFNEQTWWGSTS